VLERLHGWMEWHGIPTWPLELSIAALVLAGVALIGGGWLDALGALAVLAGFAHGQVADRLREAQERPSPGRGAVACFRMERRYFVGKELLWLLYFVSLGAWPALAGCALFLAYPLWRRAWRAHRPR
jgi:hypothetical protein